MATSDLVEDITLDDLGPRFAGEQDDLVCGECGVARMRLIAGPRGPFYGCMRYPDCKGTHGAHPDGKPFGSPANSATREARTRTHQVFDQLWKSGKMTRDEAYHWLANKLKISPRQAHIGHFDVDRCERTIQLAQAKLKEGAIRSFWNRLMGEDEY